MRQLSKTKYWNTWTAESPTNYVFLPGGFRIVPSAYSTKEDSYTTFPFGRTVKLLEHDSQGRYVHLEMNHGGTVLDLEYFKTDDWTVAGRMRCKEHGEWALRFWPEISFGFNTKQSAEQSSFNKPTIEKIDNKSAIGHCRSYFYGISVKEEPVRTCKAVNKYRVCEDIVKNGYYTPTDDEENGTWYCTLFNLEQNPEIIFAVAVTNSHTVSLDKSKKAISFFDNEKEVKSFKKHVLHDSLYVEEGEYPEAAEAIRDVMAWNTLSDDHSERWFTWITRYWDKKFGGWYVWMDDPYYHGYMNALSGDWQTGRQSIHATIDNNTPEGNFACLMSELTEWVDRSQPPIGSYMTWKYYLLTGDKALLDEVYPALRDANFWWHEHRDGNNNGVLEYGTSSTGDCHFAHTKLAAMDESSMDNSPLYDKANYNSDSHTMDMEDVALNSLLVVDGECLQLMARELGDSESIPRLNALTENLRQKANETLWDSERNIYANKLWSGEYVDLAPTSFYPLLAGMPNEEQVASLLKHLFDEDEFWTYLPLPAIYKKSKAFGDNVYWRGRVWPPLNYNVYNGLKRYKLDKEATKLAKRCMEVFSHNWKNERACFENLNSLTGEGSDSVDTDFFLGWGALLPTMWLADYFDVDPWNGVHFGSVNGEDIVLRNIRTGNGIYDLIVKNGVTTLYYGEKAVFESNSKGRYRHFENHDNYLSVSISMQEKESYINVFIKKIITATVNEKPAKIQNNKILIPPQTEAVIRVWCE